MSGSWWASSSISTLFANSAIFVSGTYRVKAEVYSKKFCPKSFTNLKPCRREILLHKDSHSCDWQIHVVFGCTSLNSCYSKDADLIILLYTKCTIFVRLKSGNFSFQSNLLNPERAKQNCSRQQFFFFYHFHLLKNIRLDVPCESSVGRGFTWNIKSYFLWKTMKKTVVCCMQSWLVL